MTERYVAFDVETPNYANNRMSAIGIAVIERGRVVEAFDTLVNPEARFDPFNIALTGITPALAADAPTFPELWPRLRAVFEGSILAAHNAPFDMGVLGKCLRDYGLSWNGSVRYVCTCRMGRALLPQLPNHKLNTLCNYLGVELDHHRAGSDSLACAQLLLHYLRSGAQLAPYLRDYDLRALRTLRTRSAAPAR